MSYLISREEALSHPFANGEYDKENANLDYILGFESYKEWLETLPIVEDRPKGLTLSEVETYANEHNYVLWTDEMSEKALALIKANRNRPKGEWDVNCQGIVFCSKCKKVINHNYDIDYMESHFNFCPNCGADMRGKVE